MKQTSTFNTFPFNINLTIFDSCLAAAILMARRPSGSSKKLSEKKSSPFTDGRKSKRKPRTVTKNIKSRKGLIKTDF